MNTEIYENWVRAGRRSCKIEISQFPADFKIKVWCFDYDVSEGVTVKFGEEPPSNEVLLGMARERAKKRMEELG